MLKRIRKAVIPAAGFGTRFLPQTKAMPKEMLPIVDKPIIQYVVESLVKAGIEDVIIVTGYHKRSIEDHFDAPSKELVDNLVKGGKAHMLSELEAISNLANFFYVRQKGPYGNGTPLLNVRSMIGDEPFIYTWSDDMIITPNENNEFQQLINTYRKYDCSVLASVRAQSDDDYLKYGFAGGTKITNGIIDIKTIIEKPGKAKSPSNLGTVSSFLFTPDIFNYLDEVLISLAPGKEFYYNDAINLMLKDKKRVLAAEIVDGKFIDTGNKLSYLKAITEFGLKHPKIGDEYRAFLNEIIRK
jgi:UTP--glucose-1-phosphate uridylyltransferase